MLMSQSIAPAINRENSREKLIFRFFRSFYCASLIVRYLWYSFSISYTVNYSSEKENNIWGYSYLFASNCALPDQRTAFTHAQGATKVEILILREERARKIPYPQS